LSGTFRYFMKNHSVDHKTSNLRAVFVINTFFALVELIGGLYTNSLAVMSNGLHDLGDSIALSLAWFFEKLAKKDRTKSFTYGYKRFSLVSAFLTSVILTTGSILIIFEAVPRLFQPEQTNTDGLLVFAVLGIIANTIAYLRIKYGKSLNEKLTALHLLNDVLGWGAVLIAGIVMKFHQILILDPILSILITLYVLWHVIGNLKKVLVLFLQGAPDYFHLEDMEKKVRAFRGVKAVHDTHIWSLEGEYDVLTTHVIVQDNLSQKSLENLKCNIKKLLSDLNVEHSTVEIEFENEKCDLTGH